MLTSLSLDCCHLYLHLLCTYLYSTHDITLKSFPCAPKFAFNTLESAFECWPQLSAVITETSWQCPQVSVQQDDISAANPTLAAGMLGTAALGAAGHTHQAVLQELVPLKWCDAGDAYRTAHSSYIFYINFVAKKLPFFTYFLNVYLVSIFIRFCGFLFVCFLFERRRDFPLLKWLLSEYS